MSSIRVVLADDHELVCAGFRLLLQQLAGVEVVATAKDGQEALELVREHRPDVAVLDVSMPRLNGLQAAERLRQECPGVRVVILSMNGSQEHVLEALRVGALGYLLKNITPEELEAAVRTAARGEVYLSGEASRHALADYLQRLSGGPPPPDRLTPRQREVLRLIALGVPTKVIARKLGVSFKTAQTHRQQLMDALDIHEVAGLTRYAIRTGLIQADD